MPASALVRARGAEGCSDPDPTPAGPQKGGGWGRGGYDTLVCFWSAAGGAHWPIPTYCPCLGPSPSIGGGAHRPLFTLCPSSPSLAHPSLSTFLPFPLEGEGGGCQCVLFGFGVHS